MQGTPRRTWDFGKLGKQAIGKPKGGLNIKIYVVSVNDKIIVETHLYVGDRHDELEERDSIETIGLKIPRLMYRVYESNKIRALTVKTVMIRLFRQSEIGKIHGDITRKIQVPQHL